MTVLDAAAAERGGHGRCDHPDPALRIAWLIASLATGWSALAAICLLWPGLGTADPDAALPAGFASQRGQFELLILTPIAAVVAAVTAYHLAARRGRRGRRAQMPA